MKNIKLLIIAVLLIMPLTTNALEINNITRMDLIMSSGSKTDSYPDLITPLQNNQEDKSCTAFVNKDGDKTPLGDFIDILFTIIKVITPVIIIIITVLDFTRNIINGTEKEIKSVMKTVTIRLIIGLLIFLLPFILQLIFNLFGLYNIETCI